MAACESEVSRASQSRCLHAEREADAEPEGWLQKTLAGGGSAVVLAFLCNKALLPVRAPITIGLTPVVARCVLWRRLGVWSVGTLHQCVQQGGCWWCRRASPSA